MLSKTVLVGAAAVATFLSTPSSGDAQQRGRVAYGGGAVLRYALPLAPPVTNYAIRSGASPGWFAAARQSLGPPRYPPGAWQGQYPMYPNYYRRSW